MPSISVCKTQFICRFQANPSSSLRLLRLDIPYAFVIYKHIVHPLCKKTRGYDKSHNLFTILFIFTFEKHTFARRTKVCFSRLLLFRHAVNNNRMRHKVNQKSVCCANIFFSPYVADMIRSAKLKCIAKFRLSHVEYGYGKVPAA